MTGGRFPLLTVAALLSQCRLLVANDSGPLHLGLALGVPTIGLLGADDPRPGRPLWGGLGRGSAQAGRGLRTGALPVEEVPREPLSDGY